MRGSMTARAMRIRTTTTIATINPVDIVSLPRVGVLVATKPSRSGHAVKLRRMPLAFDLQSHSVHSDGALPAGDVVARAAAAGVELLALSDHDTVDGVQEALVAARSAPGLALVPATELSALDGDREDLHLLGYGLDHRSPRLAGALRAFRADREGRAGRMAEALRELGWVLEL